MKVSLKSIRKNIRNNMTDLEINNKAREHGFNAGYEKGLKMGMHQMGEILYIMTAYTLEYKYKLSQEDLVKTMMWIYNNVDSYRTGHLTLDDFYVIKKEMEEKGVRYE